MRQVIFLLCFFACACHNTGDDKTLPRPQNHQLLTIALQPLNNVDINEVDYVFKEVVKIYPHVIKNKTTTLPQNCFYAARSRYRADSIIQFLSLHTVGNVVTIGLIDKDISTTKNGIKDWGVMGLGYQPGNACVVSTFRLSKDSLLQQLSKVALHELGHTQGLHHCKVRTCFMRDAEGQNPTNEEREFCSKCKAALISKGWQF